MEREPTPALNPASLPPGTLVGPWRVVTWAGHGVHGTVYRAVHRDKPFSTAVALKVALLPEAPRSAREAQVLARLRHPSIPRLWDSGEWQLPSGALHPYIAMEWVDGVPLYDWARQHTPSPIQELRVLAQLASALQVIHALGSVHRDVKGANVLVRHSDGRAMLTDFGTSHSPEAITLTPPGFYPGTPAYRSPESALFELQSFRNPAARYHAGPADDLYALGVTACRLVTGEYPRFAEPTQDEHDIWHLEAVVAPASLRHSEPRLRALILRMLSVLPDERGTPAQLAGALEQAARSSLLESAPPPRTEAMQEALSPRERPTPLRERPSLPGDTAVRASASAPTRLRHAWALATAMSLALAAGVWWVARDRTGEGSPIAHWTPARAEQPDAGATGLGEALASASVESSHELCSAEMLAEDTLPETSEGQAQPDAKGRCPRKKQVVLNGGCWAEVPLTGEECEERGGQVFKSRCYMPIFPKGRRPTSSPANKER
jgi:eukaryotic-like serine/threonine-protein kinase